MKKVQWNCSNVLGDLRVRDPDGSVHPRKMKRVTGLRMSQLTPCMFFAGHNRDVRR